MTEEVSFESLSAKSVDIPSLPDTISTDVEARKEDEENGNDGKELLKVEESQSFEETEVQKTAEVDGLSTEESSSIEDASYPPDFDDTKHTTCAMDQKEKYSKAVQVSLCCGNTIKALEDPGRSQSRLIQNQEDYEYSLEVTVIV